MQVRTGMSSMVVTVSPGVTLHDAARSMAERKVGAAVVIDPEQPGPGIITERDVLQSVGSGQDPNTELVRDHSMRDIVLCWVEDGATSSLPRDAAGSEA
jgi:CBS domain-containing protein